MLDCTSAVHAATTEGHRLTPVQYNNAINAIFGSAVTASAQYPGAYGASLSGFSTEPAMNDVGASDVDDLLLAAEDVAVSVVGALNTLLPCAAMTSTADDACAGTYIDTFAARAYRHAVTSDERASLMTTFHNATTTGSTFSDGIALMTEHILQTSQFLYVMEDAAVTPRQLTGDELASRLSFMLWDSIPDDTLTAAAAAGTLATPAGLTAQATRMLDDARADTTMARFIREWTGAVPLVAGSKDATTFPWLTDAVAASMNTSFDKYAADEIKNGSLKSLFTDATAFVDTATAPLFGVTAPPANTWQKVALDATTYTGVTTQPVLMAAMAHEETSSFNFRGKLVRVKMMCQAIGAPPANAQSVFNSLVLPPNPTGKEISAGITANTACAGCHTLLNPPGLTYEHFDAAGRFQTTYPSGRAIDTTGSMPLDSATWTFDGPVSLMSQVAASPDSSPCFDKQLFAFTFSRLDTSDDACTLQTLTSASGGDLRSTVLGVVGSQGFSWKVDSP